MCDARTDGVFQLESGGMKQVLSKLRPSCLEDIIACVALYRPGPMDSIDTFIARKHGTEKIEYKTDKLKPILDVTYGCIVYQEQVMQICRALAGYSYARADNVRRAMSKKKASVMQAERADFISGVTSRGVSSAVAEEIFEEMLGFAQYAFNKSHATAYGILSYRTAYLKAHYPAQYFSALLTSVLDNTAKVKAYIADAQRFGIRVLPPDINSSRESFTTDGKDIRFGLLAIKNVGRQFVRAILAERSRGAFLSFDEFVSRMINSDINKRTLEFMIKCGAFDSLGTTRHALISCYESILDSEHEKIRNNISGQMDLFSSVSVSSNTAYQYPDVSEYSLKELLALEKESSGMYFSGHIIDGFTDHISRIRTDKISDLLDAATEGGLDELKVKYCDRAHVKVAGVITAKRTKIVKNGDTMAFIMLEDRYAEIEVVVFARQYSKLSDFIIEDSAVVVDGALSIEEGEPAKILLSDIERLYENGTVDKKNEKSPESCFYIKVPALSDPRIQRIYRIAALNRGNTKIVIFDESTKKYSVMKDVLISSEEKVRERLSSVFSSENVVFK